MPKIKAEKQIVVSCPIKCDNEYLVEFVEHYLKLGFDKIYFYDNNDDDEIQPALFLKDYIEQDLVTMIDYRNMYFDDQVHRLDFFQFYNFDWVLFVDDDEFLELRKNRDIREFISSFDNQATKIAINYLHFGDNDFCYKQSGKVQDIFRIPLSLNLADNDGFYINSYIKSLLKKTKLQSNYFLNGHSLMNDTPYYNADGEIIKLASYSRIHNEDISYETAYIKHYCTKSLEEFCKCKIKRARTNNFKKIANRFDFTYYFLFNNLTEEKVGYINNFERK